MIHVCNQCVLAIVKIFCSVVYFILTLLLGYPAIGLAGDLVPSVALTPIVSQGLKSPLYVTHSGDGSGRLYIVEQSGTIRIHQDGHLLDAPLLDLSERVLYAYECGLLGLAFHPNYRQNGRFFVNYSTKEGCSTVIAEYRGGRDSTEPVREEKTILAIRQPETNHNGGMLAFGPDGFLYIGMGDGGGIGDPQNRSQDMQDLLGKMLRIDVDHGQPYAIPSDNPFAPEMARPEIFASGLRNPWRFSFDRETGELWLADVGLKRSEEVNVVTKGGITAGVSWKGPPVSSLWITVVRPVLFRHRLNIVTG